MKKPTKSGDAVLAARYQCTRRTISNWRKEGAPLTNAKRMDAWLADRTRLPSGLEPTTLTDARLHKTLAETRRINLEYRARAGDLISLAEVVNNFATLGAITKAAIARLPGEIPLWEGFSAPELEKRAQRLMDDICVVVQEAAARAVATKKRTASEAS